MIDIDIYRQRIGCHHPRISNFYCKPSTKNIDNLCFGMKKTICLGFITLFMFSIGCAEFELQERALNLSQPCYVGQNGRLVVHVVRGYLLLAKSAEIVDFNFEARYLHGNIQKKKGIINMHLNIRSLQSKVVEVKNLIKEHNPHIFGISESELFKDRIDENILKIPGYDVMFPKSWSMHGYARILVYVRKSFKCQQVFDLQDNRVQSIWLKGGYKNCKDIYFCHTYREHLSQESSFVQQQYLCTLLDQWESATIHNGAQEPNETHICGDLNIDVFKDKWLQSDYPLVILSRLIKNVCHANNFHQLVQDVTRVQFNSVANTVEASCIDHIYTNTKYRCSTPSIISFGGSDHDLIKYTRYSKIPRIPVRVVYKRSYKNFDKSKFLRDMNQMDWTDVFLCWDVNDATETFTQKFKYILNQHAPWTRIQERKNFAPWLTNDTKRMIKERDQCKFEAKALAKGSTEVCQAQSQLWAQYKKSEIG